MLKIKLLIGSSLQKLEAIAEQNAVVENGVVTVAANGVTPRE
jgi:hypothetical protein